MLSPPRDLAEDDLARVLATHWGVRGPIMYRPVGFGSHHWTVGDRFVTVDEGPYARRAAELLTTHAATIAAAHDRYAGLVDRVDRGRMVLTHGEPHPGNTMRTPDGWRLIDWDTALAAPPERDLWHLATPETLAAYEEATGVRPVAEVLALYRLRWDLTDLTEFATGFARPHDGSADDAESWRLLCALLAGLASGPR